MGVFKNIEIKDIAPKAYLPFAAYVIQTRALPDSRDCLKSGGRYILWSQYLNKNTSHKARIKANDAVGSIMKFNPHGDRGIYDNLVRFAKPFAMRYPLEDAKGNTGTMTRGDDHTASRYLEIRASQIADEFYYLVDKGGIENMKLNYTQTLEYPEAFPTLFPNFVNGNTGIGVGCASSLPQYNLVEAIDSLKKLVYDRNIDFDEIYIAPDFATGAIITNADEVKESLKFGKGKAVKMRAKIEYDSDEHCLIVTQVPFQVFTNRIMNELAVLEEAGKLQGIKSYFDGTDKSCGRYGTKIRIYLTKNANPASICRFLYKHTSLQSHFSLNCLMLENGVKPKVYGQREMMLAYLNNMESSITRSYHFEKAKLEEKINILRGYLIAIAHIEEIVQVIKTSRDSEDASNKLIESFNFNMAQAKAILDLKLQKLVGLEGIKINNDLKNAEARANEIENILNTKELFNSEIIKILDRIQKAYGDERRTEVLNIEGEDIEEPIERKQLVIYLTNQNNIYAYEDSSLISHRRGSVGTKLRLNEGEIVINTITDSNYSNALFFTDKGKVYDYAIDKIVLNAKVPVESLIELEPGEQITDMISDTEGKSSDYVLFVTKNGIVKKTARKEYKTRRKTGIQSIKLKDDDFIKKVFLINDSDALGIATKDGYFVYFDSKEIPATGRASYGVKGINLRNGDEVQSSLILDKKSNKIISVSKNGLMEKVELSDFNKGTRGNKGIIMQKFLDEDSLAAVLALEKDKNLIITSTNSCVKIKSKEIPVTGRASLGRKSIELHSGNYVTGVISE